MAQAPRWGDELPHSTRDQPGTTVTGNTPEARAETGEIVLDDFDKAVETFIQNDMAGVVHPPISPSQPRFTCEGWTVEHLLAQGKRFVAVPRVSATSSANTLVNAIEESERTGVPLVIEGWHNHSKWPKDKFSLDWLRENGDQGVCSYIFGFVENLNATRAAINVRNVHDGSDKSMQLLDFISQSRSASKFVTPEGMLSKTPCLRDRDFATDLDI